jgi:hypothetical protein
MQGGSVVGQAAFLVYCSRIISFSSRRFFYQTIEAGENKALKIAATRKTGGSVRAISP